MTGMSESPQSPQAGAIPAWTIGWRMQRALAHAGVSVEEISDELGVSRSSVSRWLNDRALPRAAYLKVWALRTGVAYEWLAGDQFPRRAWSRKAPTLTPSEHSVTAAVLGLAA